MQRLLFHAVLGLVPLLTGVTNPPDQRRTIRIGALGKFDTLHPYFQRASSRYVRPLYLRPLLYLDDHKRWVCSLCDRVPGEKDIKSVRIKRGRRKIVTTWRLKPSLRWADGTPLTSHDIQFSWKVLKETTSDDSGGFSFIDKIDSIEIGGRDPRKFTITYTDADPRFYQMKNFFIIPRHLEQPVWKASNGDIRVYRRTSLYTTQPKSLGLFNGPYTLNSKVSEGRLYFKRNEQFFGAAPKFPYARVLYSESPGELRYFARNGYIDMLQEGIIPFAKAVKLHHEANSRKLPIRVLQKDNNYYEHVAFNLRNPVLADRNFRRALTTSINRNSIVNRLSGGGYSLAHHPIRLNKWASVKNKEPVYSPKRAAQLFDLAGIKLNSKNLRVEIANKKPIVLELVVPAEDKERKETAELIVANLRQVGITVKLKYLSRRIFNKKVIGRAQFSDMALFSWRLPDDDLPISILHSKQIPSYENQYRGQNVYSWRNQSVDDALKQYQKATGPEEIKEIVAVIINEFSEYQPHLPLFFGTDTALVAQDIAGVRLSGHATPATFWVEEWRRNR